MERPLTGLVTQSRFTPRCYRSWTADRRFALTTTMRMVYWVHSGTANGRSPAHVTLTAGLADLDILMIDVTDLTDSCFAILRKVAKFTGRQTHKRITIFFSHKLCHYSSCTGKLPASTRIKLYIVYKGTNGNIYHGQRIAGFNIGR